MPNPRSLNVVVPALNEEGSLAATLDEIMDIVKEDFPDFEILVFDDGSSDKTGAIADDYARRYPHIRAFHNPHPLGIALATKHYYMHVHGDNEITGTSIQNILRSASKADFVITYILDDSGRAQTRQQLSVYFTRLVTARFGRRLKY